MLTNILTCASKKILSFYKAASSA